VVRLTRAQLAERALVFRADLALVALRKGEERLVPDDRQRALFLFKAREVVDERVDHAIRKSVPLVQQYAQEERRHAGVVQLRNAEHRGGRVERRD
jgi:hypothetical protein